MDHKLYLILERNMCVCCFSTANVRMSSISGSKSHSIVFVNAVIASGNDATPRLSRYW